MQRIVTRPEEIRAIFYVDAAHCYTTRGVSGHFVLIQRIATRPEEIGAILC